MFLIIAVQQQHVTIEDDTEYILNKVDLLSTLLVVIKNPSQNCGLWKFE